MRTRKSNHDHLVATVARVVAGGVGLLAALVFFRSLPELVRYVKLERL
jgi:hypothetical protein